jgi:molybdopterin converting factor subunit 1
MSVEVLFFASSRDAAGLKRTVLELPAVPATAAAVLDALVERFPGLQPMRSSLALAVADAVVAWDHAIKPGDEVSVIPPLSGG